MTAIDPRTLTPDDQAALTTLLTSGWAVQYSPIARMWRLCHSGNRWSTSLHAEPGKAIAAAMGIVDGARRWVEDKARLRMRLREGEGDVAERI
jgi:hypothetical protein